MIATRDNRQQSLNLPKRLGGGAEDGFLAGGLYEHGYVRGVTGE